MSLLGIVFGVLVWVKVQNVAISRFARILSIRTDGSKANGCFMEFREKVNIRYLISL